MTRLYTLVMYLLTPVILYRLVIRGLRARAYFWRWRERFGFFPAPPFKSSVWVHAVSVGEFNAALPLIRQLMTRYPDQALVVTTVTPTGSEQVLRNLGDDVFHVYLPYDLPAAINRFLKRTKPLFAVVMETEIWPNLFFVCKERGIPLVVANARLSERSLQGYRPVRPLVAKALNCAAAVAAQTETDRQRLAKLGGRPELLHVVGSLKFDLQLPPGLEQFGQEIRSDWGPERLVVVAASTHEDDEEALLPAFMDLLRRHPDALLIIAPRHPERFGRVITRCRALGLATASRSEDLAASTTTEVFVLDTMGELLNYFAAADLAFVGGSIAQVGGHNVLEPAALGVPVLVGPHTFNFAEITEMLLSRNGALRVEDQATLARRLLELAENPQLRQQMGRCGFELVQENRGALTRTLELVETAVQDLQPLRSSTRTVEPPASART
ncbi:MAG: lipid IV(A) 3-deoxy-D-manno-octulosonic acid transferase [Pseudomonadota bacterium]